ncbi:hypothetical protein [Rhizobium beringeri]|uniref:hypothetical protein n=1 Tax=Rhizobium beringeri TaxID=3019934 RepID=UPI002E0FB5B6|nr:hypothetical protein U8P75_16270 [Rhizobium beringeri]WSH78855.1 hypothetical protein U8P69_16160 [Rhizobium beringeri]
MEQIEITVVLGKYVVGGAVDRAISEADLSGNYKSTSFRHYIFDLSDTRFISVGCSQYIVAFSMKCARHRWKFTLVMPEAKEVRDFWRLWNFYDAMEVACKLTLADIVPARQLELVSERQTTFRERSTATSYRAGPSSLRSENFFGFHSIRLGRANDGMAAVEEADQWRTKEIKDILEKGLQTRSDYVATRIVFEAIFNAVRHPGANLVQTCSWHPYFYHRMKESNGDQSGSPFSLVFWDDGRSFLSVMDEALGNGIKLRSEVPEEYTQNYVLRTFNKIARAAPIDTPVSHSILLDTSTSEEVRLLSTIFPGVSTSKLQNEDEDASLNAPELSRRGMGLFILVDTVCNDLGEKYRSEPDDISCRFQSLGQSCVINTMRVLLQKLPNSQEMFQHFMEICFL